MDSICIWKKKRIRKFFWASVVFGILLICLKSASPAYAEGNYYYARLYGKDRYETSYRIAQELFVINNRFDNVVVASGMNYPDALSGCYLANLKEAPMMLVGPNTEANTLAKIRAYAKPGATVYLLGGSGSISKRFEAQVKGAGFKIKRLAMNDRYGTNLKILQECGIQGKDLLVASGLNYPDSLSASAVPKPLLLVGNALTKEQKALLASASVRRIYILGGTGSVSPAVEKELHAYGLPVGRIGGANRFETSYLIAKKFFPQTTDLTLAYGHNFPDGLSAGPLAMCTKSPILLCNSDKPVYQSAHKYLGEAGAYSGYVIGGPTLISKQAADYVFSSRYTIQFRGNGATSGTMEPLDGNYDIQELPANQFVRPGYRFTGWNTQANGYGISFSDRETIIDPPVRMGGSLTLYARWEPTPYYITYILRVGEQNYRNPSSYTIESPTITLLDPKHPNHVFGGWYSDPGYKNRVYSIPHGSTGDITLYAKWMAPIKSFREGDYTCTIQEGYQGHPKIRYAPTTAEDVPSYTLTNPDVAKVLDIRMSDGVMEFDIAGLKPGETDIILKSSVGAEASIRVNVVPKKQTTSGFNSAELNKPVTLSFMKTTFTKLFQTFDLKPSDTSDYYSYYKGEEGNHYVVFEGRVKNTGSFTYRPGNSLAKFIFDDRYYYNAWIYVEEDNYLGSYENVVPFDETRIVITALIPDELLSKYNTLTVQWGFTDNFGTYSSDHYNYVFDWEDCTYRYEWHLIR